MTTMTQQVNLLIDDLRPQRVMLTSLHALIGVAAYGALLVSISLYQWFSVSGISEQRELLSRAARNARRR